MKRALRYPAVAASGPRFAADLVNVVREGARIRLDYSVGSLTAVDQVIEDIRREAPPPPAVAETLVGFGAYVGEVLVRQADGWWVDFDRTIDQAVDRTACEWFEYSLGVRTPDGRVWNPLGKAFERFERGPRHSLYRFVQTAVGGGDG